MIPENDLFPGYLFISEEKTNDEENLISLIYKKFYFKNNIKSSNNLFDMLYNLNSDSSEDSESNLDFVFQNMDKIQRKNFNSLVKIRFEHDKLYESLKSHLPRGLYLDYYNYIIGEDKF